VSEVILQQTRVDQGLPYYRRFMAAFPTVRALALASEDRVLKLWEGLGYYTRARNLLKAARIIVNDRGGRFPRTVAEWRTLPGVGRYTAGAIASIAFGKRAPVLDGNVKRVLSRLFNIAACIDAARTQARLWSLAESLVPSRFPGDFNQAMMELGARVCVARLPLCRACPVRGLCRAYAAGTQDRRPVRRASRRIPHQEIVIAAIRKNGRYLLAKRPAAGLLGGLWEFPGGKVAPGERHPQALARMAREDLGIAIAVDRPIATVNHTYSHVRVTSHVYLCRHVRGVPRPKVHTDLKWIARAAIPRYPLPKANHKFLHLL
jgi:A/G-specific adenine glycosylase